jgi:hypothetical protein
VPRRPEPIARDEFNPGAAFAACILPGAGHFLLGDRPRAICIGVGVLSLFFGGVLIGGIDVIDRKEDTIWFAGQALVGPIAFGVDYLHQNQFKVMDSGRLRTANPEIRDASGKLVSPGEVRDPSGRPAAAPPGTPPPNSKSLGRMNELGTLFATIAGMLNLIAIIDAAFRPRVSPLRALGLQTLADGERGTARPQPVITPRREGPR